MEMKKLYAECQKKVGSYEFYNIIEKYLIGVDLNDKEKDKVKDLSLDTTLLKEIKVLAICLSRFKPADWNRFLDVVLK